MVEQQRFECPKCQNRDVSGLAKLFDFLGG